MNTTDPSLSVELRFWVQTRLRFDGSQYVCAHETPFEDVRAAVQAAWLADSFDLVLEIMQSHGLRGAMCPRCTLRPCATREVAPQPGTSPHRVWWHLCEVCARSLIILTAYERERKRIETAGAK
jgi:hypothetical protein